MSPKVAYVTLLTKPAYLPGTLVLDNSLRAVGSRYPLVVMVTPSLDQDARNILKKRGIPMAEVQTLQPEAGVHTLAAHDTRFADTWTKLRAFGLIDYERIVLLDSDMLVMRNMDELMDLELPKDWVAAAHVCACNPRKLIHYPSDWIPSNCAHTAVAHPTAPPPPVKESSPRPYSQLNSGTIVLQPTPEISKAIVHFLATSSDIPKFSFPDQDLLTAFFKGKWKPLPWYYNAFRTLRIIHQPLWSDTEVRCLHYILPDKPWHTRTREPGTGGEFETVNKWWWESFKKLGEVMQGTDPTGWKLVLENINSVKAA